MNTASEHRHRHALHHAALARRGKGISRIGFLAAGAACLLWYLIRVIPKPSRATYPCMKVAAPVAGGFVTYVLGALGLAHALGRARHHMRAARPVLAGACVLAGLAAGALAVLITDTGASAVGLATDSVFVPTDPPNSPMGVARGIFPGRVVWMWDSSAATWDGKTGNWWNDASTNQTAVDSMISRGLCTLTGAPGDSAAWDALFRYFNARHGKGNVPYRGGEKIAVKINLVTSSFPGSIGNLPFAAPQTVLALTRELVTQAGVADSDITFYDTDRYVPDPMYNKVHAAFPHVHFTGWQQINGREQYVRDTTRVHWSEALTMEINGGHPAYLPTVVTHAAYIINLGSFKAHRYMGVTFCSKNHFGTLSCDGPDGLPYQNAPHAAGLHCYTAVHDIVIPGSAEWSFTGRPMGSYNTLVDLMGHKDLGAKTLLFMIDALYGVEMESADVSLNSRWQSPPFNNRWTSSLFFSQDNVAIESVGLDFYREEQTVNPNYTNTYGAVDNYLHEAALADNPPSGTYYSPSGDSVRLQSLGVHEHWNNAVAKQYSRNLGTGAGIELVRGPGAVTSVPPAASPAGFALRQNYPNPFNPSTTISYTLGSAADVRIDVFDVRGALVAVLATGRRAAGSHTVSFDGARLSSGTYFCRMQAGTFLATKRMLLLR
ncbi:MAG TPA: DUF362 domain-containing protein [Bacteroidota bacterium]|nr:DUF362 domain-containing protein [Bacteroidota bacterium]